MYNASNVIFGSTLALADATPVTAAADGQLSSTKIAGDTFALNSSRNAESGHIRATLGWARWGDGSVTQTSATGTTSARTIPVNGGYAHIWGAPVTAMPTAGLVNYTMAGATKPIQLDGAVAPGTVDRASLVVHFGTRMLGFEAALTMPNASYVLATDGGLASPGVSIDSANAFSAALVSQGAVSTGSMVGFFAGAGASAAGVAYQINGTTTGVTGVIAFSKP